MVTWSDAYFDDVSPGQDQLLHHFSSHHISCLSKIKIIQKNVVQHLILFPHLKGIKQTSTDHNSVCQELLPDFFDEEDKLLRVAVGHVNADVLQLGHCLQDGGDPLKVTVAGP